MELLEGCKGNTEGYGQVLAMAQEHVQDNNLTES